MYECKCLPRKNVGKMHEEGAACTQKLEVGGGGGGEAGGNKGRIYIEREPPSPPAEAARHRKGHEAIRK